MRRAAHQILDDPKVFEHSLALRILGPEDQAELRRNLGDYEAPRLRPLRAFLAARSRYAEDALSEAYARGVRQYLVLGAGLDTFAYRSERSSLRVFEVDHPATQAWKRERLAAAGIAIPPFLTFAPIDFEREKLPAALERAAFDATAPAYISWLGVTIYLTRTAVMETIAFVAARPVGTEMVFDFSTPAAAQSALAARVAAADEPWVTFFEPGDLARELTEMGFRRVDVLGPREINARYFAQRSDSLSVGPVGHLMHLVV
jgi:methyltransferase (TIGR00027 family)